MAMAHTLMDGLSASEFLQGLQEEHSSELAFILAQRQRYLHDAEVEWPDVESLEIRIHRHAEAMRVGGEAALACAREALAGEAWDELAAGVYARVFIGPEDEGIAEVLARMAKLDTVLLPYCTQALMLVQHPQLSERLAALLDSPRESVRAAAVRVIGHRRDSGAGPLLPLLDDVDLEVRAAAALAVSEMGHRPALPILERKMAQAPADEMDVWALAALRLGSSRALHACRQSCHADRPLPPRLPWLLGLAGEAQDFGLLRQLCGRLESMVGSLEALGMLGVPTAVPLLLDHLGHEKPAVKNAAAKALSLMTGAGLTETVQIPDEWSREGDEAEFQQVVQPSTDSSSWRAWWNAHRARLEGASRLRLGQPYSLSLCLEELVHSRTPFDARARAGLELVIRSGQTVGFQPDWPVRRQRQAIEQWRQCMVNQNWK
ncbi:HEAT repeat domain-containing protein [Archangium violaceum]|uniref:HEAT repeat domain-containing protein n=1 Tax=Archangium violaceum TaxID=83451 RepID=UPI00193C7C45|nr:HEAT repeat domain-containing protein [Archangium violaceum]QRK11093.1 HEAT repeat domain-containing protein [Archangium violaceum]